MQLILKHLTMKNALLISCKVFFFCLAFPLYFHAQTNTTTAGSDYYFYPVEGNNHWLKVKDGIQLSASDLARSHKAQL